MDVRKLDNIEYTNTKFIYVRTDGKSLNVG